jgi:hypothetical protein
VALPLTAAARLVDLPAVQAERARPAVRAACLDVALARAPVPTMPLHLGLASPTYAALHGRVADVAPAGGEALHVARYLAPDETIPAAALRAELEAIADSLQPGWREHAHDIRFAPAWTVQSTLVTADRGLAGRPSSTTSVAGLTLAGDWVGPEGLLADGSFASARAAVASLLAERVAA